MRKKEYTKIDEFKSDNLDRTINSMYKLGEGQLFGTNKVPDYMKADIQNLLKQGYAITGDKNDAIGWVQRATGNSIGVSKVNQIEKFGPNAGTLMLYPPEKIYPNLSPAQIRDQVNSDIAPILKQDRYKGLDPNKVFIGSDELTRQSPKNPSYMLYYMDGNERVPLVDENNMPKRFSVGANEIQQKAKQDNIDSAMQERKDAIANPQNSSLSDVTSNPEGTVKLVPGPSSENNLPKPQQTAQATSVMQLAEMYVGKNEQTDKYVLANFFHKALGTRVDPSRTPWCAAFVNSVLQTQGVKGTGSLTAVSFLKFGTPTLSPSVGDVVVTKPLSRGATGHVGFFVDKVVQNGESYIKILAGNAHNNVAYQLIKEADIRGFRVPPTANDMKHIMLGNK
jgi:uncharacterized protein (TIGR02594 family)